MKNVNLKFLVLIVASMFVLSNVAQANFNMIKAYKDAFPDTHPKCINCHVDEKPKKEDGQHENNDYGKAAQAAVEADTATAKAATESKISPDDLKLLSDKFSKLGSIEDFKKTAGK